MHLQTLYQCTPERVFPTSKCKPFLSHADMVAKLNAPVCDLPVYGCHFGHTVITSFSGVKSFITTHKNVMVDSYEDENNVVSDINTPTDTPIMNFAKIHDNAEYPICITYNPLHLGSSVGISVREFTLLMIAYALAYERGVFDFRDVMEAAELMAKDDLFGLNTAQKVTEACDTHSIMAILNSVDFEFEKQYKMKSQISATIGQDNESLIAIGYVANAFLTHGLIG